MNKSVRISLIVVGLLLASAIVFFAGFGFASNRLLPSGSWMDGQMTGGMMLGNNQETYSGGMMGGGDQNFAYGMGMMSASMMMNGMMNSDFFASYNGDPITMDEAESAIFDYISSLGDDDLLLGEIMIFENHAYAQIIEESTGIGALEILVDPETFAVYPEFGPAMMWNTKYGGIGSFDMAGMMGMGNMMGSYHGNDFEKDQLISPESAVEIAQEYLRKVSADLVPDDHADQFYGYFTLHTLQDNEVVGMLSVNAYTGEVFPHTWHGELLEMSGE